MKRIIIAIDGPAGSGKSTVSSKAALSLKIKYIDSGALYRAITWFVLSKYNKIPPDLNYVQELKNLKIRQIFNKDGLTETFVNEQNVSTLIRDESIAQNIKRVCDDIEVRNFVNYLLKSLAQQESIIMDGRDIGSVVFPKADLKIYLDASVEQRAWRRVKDYQEMGKKVDQALIKEQIITRDNQDKSRSYGALRQCEDSFYLDTSNLNIDQVVRKIVDLAERIDQK